MSEDLKEASGVVGIYMPSGESASRELFYCLYAVQHRGPRAAWMATSTGEHLVTRSGPGLVSQVFDEEDLRNLKGSTGIACNESEYSLDTQPVIVKEHGEELTVALNGNLINAQVLRESVLNNLATKSQSELIAQLILSTSDVDWETRLAMVMKKLVGAYSLTVLTKDKVFGIRDPLGLKPLCLGQVGNAWIIVSESCALDHFGATSIRDIEPGEVVQLDQTGVKSFFPLGHSTSQAFCSLEATYGLRPDHHAGNLTAHSTRHLLGVRLALEQPTPNGDLVIGVPDSATLAAIGYAEASGIPYRQGLIKNRYVGSTKVRPNELIARAGVGLKFNALEAVLKGKRVVVVDDRIALGETTKHVNELVRRAGAEEVHMRITTPPLKHKCQYGVELGAKKGLIAAGQSNEQIRQFIGADSLGFLSLEGLNDVTGLQTNACNACFTGLYPTAVQLELP